MVFWKKKSQKSAQFGRADAGRVPCACCSACAELKCGMT